MDFSRRVRPPDQQPAHSPLCGELIVTYAFDLPDSFMMATPRLVEQAGVSHAEIQGDRRHKERGPTGL